MTQLAEKLLTFDEFAALDLDGRYELVNGRLEELVPNSPYHGWTVGRIFSLLDAYLDVHQPDTYWGVELAFPTVPYHGRQPAFVYYSPEDVRRGIDYEAARTTGVPTLAVEVLSPDDPDRDLVTKRREYAQVGIPHYWILDPVGKTALLLDLKDGEYEVAGRFSGSERISTALFPGLEIPLARLFR